ncbi:MAG: DUF4097 domain-containing protein [Lachnospiraceae bacterium]|nr:DUF4097 domain-containing protein [Lachnospiraceae bacterium]
MKSTTKTLLIIAIVFVFGGLLLAGLGHAMGGSTKFTYAFEDGKLNFTKDSNNFVSDTVTVSKFDKLVVNSQIVDIDISDSGTDYQVSYHLPERFVPEISSGDTLSIMVPGGDDHFHVNLFTFDDYENARITISIPRSDSDLVFDLESSTGEITIENVSFNGKLKTSTGDISISDSDLGNLEIITSNGDAEYKKITCPEMKTTASTGESHFDNCEIGTLTGKTQTGDIHIKNSRVKSFNVEGSTSDIELKNVRTDDVNINVSTGECELEIDGSPEDYSCHLVSSTGDIEFGDAEHEKEFTYNGGSKNINIRTSTGDITVDFD